MKFKAELRNIRTFSKLVAALSPLDKVVCMSVDDDTIRFIVTPNKGSAVWSTFHREFLFDRYLIISKAENNRIDLELPVASLQRALKSALNSSDAILRLSKRHDGLPFLSMTIHTMANSRTGISGGGSGGGGGRRPGTYGQESTFGDYGDASQMGHTGREDREVDLTVRREREKVVIQEVPVRLLRDAESHMPEPTVGEADVNIVLPPLMQLKAVSDRFTKLAHTTSGSGSSGLHLLSTAASTSSSGSGPKLELSANMYGTLRLRLVTDTLSVETVWNDLENPPMNEEALPMPLSEHPTTKFREAGPDKFATVLVDGRDWSRVLSVGRLDGRVIACFSDAQTLVLHVYVAQPDELDGPEETSSITYYVTSYSS